MKKRLLFVFVCLTLYQTCFSGSGRASAVTAVPDTLSWTWEVSSTVSTQTKTCTFEFSGNLLVNWGDGITEWIPDSLSSKAIAHVYPVQANYSCTAIGVGISYFKADSKRLLNINVTKAPALTYLNITSNQVGMIDLSKNFLLTSLYCAGNSLKGLNLIQNTKLQTLTCSDNELLKLDVSMLPSLKKITCHTNPLTKLSINSNGALTYLSCTDCNLTADMLDSIFVHLPVLSVASTTKNLYVLNNPGSATCHTEIAAAKNWTLDRVITQSSFYVPSVTCMTADSAKVNICLRNTDPAVAFELDVLIPDGFVLDTLRSGLSPGRKGNHLLSVARMSEFTQTYKIIAYSMNLKDVFSGTDGSVLELYMKVPESVKTYTLDLQSAILLDTLTNPMAVSLTDGQIRVTTISLTGDANGDKTVDVTDVVNLVAFINGRGPSNINSAAIDIDGNGVWNVIDIARLVTLIFNSGETMTKAVSRRSSSPDMSSLSLYHAEEAAPGNHLYVRSQAKDPSCLELCLDNMDEVQAFQVDLILPEGLSLQTGTYPQSQGRNSGHVFSIHQCSENSYRLLSYAMKPDVAFQGKTGILASLPLKGTENLPEGSYPVFMKQAVLTGMNLYSVASKPYDAVLDLSSEEGLEKSPRFGTDGNSHLWVSGEEISEITVWDFSGKLLLRKPLNKVNFYSIPLPHGNYLVRACASNKAGDIQKVVVK